LLDRPLTRSRDEDLVAEAFGKYMRCCERERRVNLGTSTRKASACLTYPLGLRNVKPLCGPFASIRERLVSRLDRVDLLALQFEFVVRLGIAPLQVIFEFAFVPKVDVALVVTDSERCQIRLGSSRWSSQCEEQVDGWSWAGHDPRDEGGEFGAVLSLALALDGAGRR
jgi:hypothetical protein